MCDKRHGIPLSLSTFLSLRTSCFSLSLPPCSVLCCRCERTQSRPSSSLSLSRCFPALAVSHTHRKHRNLFHLRLSLLPCVPLFARREEARESEWAKSLEATLATVLPSSPSLPQHLLHRRCRRRRCCLAVLDDNISPLDSTGKFLAFSLPFFTEH